MTAAFSWHPGVTVGVQSQVCSQWCPGLSFRAGSLHARGCVLGQGLCLLSGLALSLPGENSMLLWGKDEGERIDPWQGRVLQLWRGCCMGQGCSQSHLMPRSFPKGLFTSTFSAGDSCWSLCCLESAIPVFFSSAWWQWKPSCAGQSRG